MDVSKQFPALADATRRAVFESLALRPQSVGELAERLPVSRPAVSQHLKVLQEASLVRFERAGTRNIYEVDRDGLAAMRTYLEALWAEALGSLKTTAEATWQAKTRKERR
jgi:DNA-binding transcriptional ArsR family regulator